ncbi:MAG: RNA pseudouridine synthase, partial [Deltaproteobacteria bacterium]|nr:RNA pseudouridine synthase [Deltaproteobacteria bacterium]
YLYAKGEWKPRAEHAFAPALCNRIDRNTGGIVIAAKTAEALRILNQKMKDRELEKKYLCVVHGIPRPREGKLEGYIFKDAKQNRVYVTERPQPGSKTAVTRYRTLQSRDDLSLVECELITGRTHQIRAMMAAAGTPLLGDGKYGKLDRRFDRKYQALYSYKLKFSFTTDAGCLAYLDGKEFAAAQVDFADEFFPGSYRTLTNG